MDIDRSQTASSTPRKHVRFTEEIPYYRQLQKLSEDQYQEFWPPFKSVRKLNDSTWQSKVAIGVFGEKKSTTVFRIAQGSTPGEAINKAAGELYDHIYGKTARKRSFFVQTEDEHTPKTICTKDLESRNSSIVSSPIVTPAGKKQTKAEENRLRVEANKNAQAEKKREQIIALEAKRREKSRKREIKAAEAQKEKSETQLKREQQRLGKPRSDREPRIIEAEEAIARNFIDPNYGLFEEEVAMERDHSKDPPIDAKFHPDVNPFANPATFERDLRSFYAQTCFWNEQEVTSDETDITERLEYQLEHSLQLSRVLSQHSYLPGHEDFIEEVPENLPTVVSPPSASPFTAGSVEASLDEELERIWPGDLMLPQGSATYGD